MNIYNLRAVTCHLALAFFMLAGTLAAHAQSAASFTPLSYGATGSGITLDTTAVQKAIDAAAAAGSNAQVWIPPATTFLVGSLTLRSGIDFQVDGDLLLSTNRADYAGDAFICAANASDIMIHGGGTISGRSLAFMTGFDRAGECWSNASWQPQMFLLTNCANITIRDLTFGDAPYLGLHLVGCSNVLVDHVTVRDRLEAPSGNGVDVDDCRQVEIRNCDVVSGDDAIVIKNTRPTPEFAACANIYVHDCVVQTAAAGLKIGTETAGDIHDITFERCRITSSGRGMAIQLRDAGSVSNVVFNDIRFLSHRFAMPWWGQGEGISLTALPRQTGTKLGMMQGILITNITGRSENSLRIAGSPGSHIRNVQMEGLSVTVDHWTKYPGGHYDNRPSASLEPLETHVTTGLDIRYADGVLLKDVTLRWGKNLPPYFTSALETEASTAVEVWNFKGAAAHPERYPEMRLR